MRKYLIEASDEEGEGFKIRRGINLIRLISNPNHANIHEDEDETIKVLVKRMRIKINV